MSSCFVIQPFDDGVYDKRYEDTFRVAIEAAGLEPYRVDQDPSVAVPIREIEHGIRNADVCFAEISTDNPNVWFELGYAIAAKKPVVMVCSQVRTRFPFDVQHRTVIPYKTEAASDFANLAQEITARLKAAVERQRDLEDIADISPVAPAGGLSDHETVALVTVASYGAVPSELASRWMVKQDMNRAGYTDIAVTLAIRSLLRRKFVVEYMTEDDRGNDYMCVDATDAGLDWLETNENRILFRQEPKEPSDDLPF
jgi:hypothetical protein